LQTIDPATADSFTENVFVRKINAAGTLLWATVGGGEKRDVGSAVAADANGFTLVAGSFNSASVAFGVDCRALLAPHGSWEPPHWDAFVAKVRTLPPLSKGRRRPG